MKALIFDLDGTLVESLPGIAASLNSAMAAHNFTDHSHTAVRTFIGDGAQMLVRRALPGGADDELQASVLEHFGNEYGRAWLAGTEVYPGILELLAELKSSGIPLTVLSNKPHSFTVEIVEKLFPEGTFEIILGNREDLPHKPDPQGALEICRELGIAAADCTLIGDSTMDLDTAKNAGMKSIAVTWGYHDRERLSAADEITDNVESLARLLAV
ncbi:HAD family hydrolase [Luteolibacter sp. AS25]|uniref:HAD family hydrolase n=1 Tax=Luteolibacter sp. AS25 TaxID=3135776 RepID=UPI00398A80F7